MVHQHFMLIPVMTVAENIVLGVEPRATACLLDERGAERRVRELSRAVRARRRPDGARREHHASASSSASRS